MRSAAQSRSQLCGLSIIVSYFQMEGEGEGGRKREKRRGGEDGIIIVTPTEVTNTKAS